MERLEIHQSPSVCTWVPSCAQRHPPLVLLPPSVSFLSTHSWLLGIPHNLSLFLFSVLSTYLFIYYLSTYHAFVYLASIYLSSVHLCSCFYYLQCEEKAMAES